MDADGNSQQMLPHIQTLFISIDWSVQLAASLCFLFLLLLLSACVAAAEVAFFSLSPADIESLEKEETTISEKILKLINAPRMLLSTLLILINLINIGIVLFSETIFDEYVIFYDLFWLKASSFKFITKIAVDTFLIVLFCEVIPKIYANSNKINVARFLATPIEWMRKILYPLSYLLVSTSNFLEEKIKPNRSINLDDLDQAIDIASNKEEAKPDFKILKGVVKFANTQAKQIMRSRLEMVSISDKLSFSELMHVVRDSGYSRIPVYSESIDKISGVLYTKDLIPHIEKETFEWSTLLREALFIPETKRINDLLYDFQESRMHLAIVVDEYGGTSGLVTLEDVLEEVVGEIQDEFDEEHEEKLVYKINERTFIFDAKIPLEDFFREMPDEIEEHLEKNRGEADSLAGLILELLGKIPARQEIIPFSGGTFQILSLHKRRIFKVKVQLTHN